MLVKTRLPILAPPDTFAPITTVGTGTGSGAGTTGGMANPPSPPAKASNPTADPFSGEAQLTEDQISQLRSVIQQAAGGLGSSFSAGQFETAINSKLQELGWSPAEILAAQQGENISEPHGAGFVEQNKGGGFAAAAARDWGNNLVSSLNGYLAGIFKPAATPITTQPVAVLAPNDTTIPSTVTDAGNLLSGSGAAGVPGAGDIGSMLPGATSPTTTTSSGGANTIAILAIVAALGLIGWYMWKKSKRPKHSAGTPGEGGGGSKE